MSKEQVYQSYDAFIDDPSHIYDGDTINHVHFKIAQVVPSYPDGEVYPGMFVNNGELWVHTNVRLAGIDCPELHPHHRLPDGTLRDDKDIGYEEGLAYRARKRVVDMLVANKLKFQIRNPQFGKYAERVVAEVWLVHYGPKEEKLINLSDRLLAENLAYPYDGGTKQIWHMPE